MKSIATILILAVMVGVGLGSCSKETVDSAERDIVLNVIRTGKWKQQTKIVIDGEAASDTTEMLKEGDYLEFKNDGRAWTYRSDGSAASVDYNLTGTKEMVYGGISYKIKENIVGKISTMTFTRMEGDMETKIIFNR